MKFIINILLIFLRLKLYAFQEPCSFNLECENCYPEYLPTVVSHNVLNNEIVVPHGEEATLHCHTKPFKLNSEKNIIKAICHNGIFRIVDDSILVNPAELGCQTDYFEDIQHHVSTCKSAYQGRSFQYYDSMHSKILHLAEFCCEPENGRTAYGHMTFAEHNDIVHQGHTDTVNRFSLLENFSSMIDNGTKIETDKIYSEDKIMFHRMKDLLGKDKFNFADHTLISTKLIPSRFFYKQNGLVTKFPANKVALWKSIAHGNLKHIHEDIIMTFYNKNNSTDVVDVYVGTFGTLSLPLLNKQKDVYLKPGKKYPVPKYLYTIIHNKTQRKAVALTLINNPFISLSEIRSAVFCPSMCTSVNWLKHLKSNYNFERVTYGIVFCCDIHAFSHIVGDGPSIGSMIPFGENGTLKD